MNGRWAIDRKKGINPAAAWERGSATVEAAIVLPIFLIALFSLAWVIRIFFAYNIMQSALQNVARNISSASYFYYVSGLKGYSDKLDEMAEEASGQLEGQKDLVLGAVDSFNSVISSVSDMQGSTSTSLDVKIEDLQALYDSGTGLINNSTEIVNLVKEILKDPKAEAKLFITVFAQKAAYAVRKELVCLVARCLLDAELERKAGSGKNAGEYLGMKNISLSQSQIFGDKESLEFIVTYEVHPPGIFGLAPVMTLSNRVKLIAWTGGRGESVRVKAAKEEGSSGNGSIWTEMDNDKRYWDRGLEIEKFEVEKLRQAAGSGFRFMATDVKFPAVDAFIYNDATVQAYDVFTLNPFMQTYVSQPSKIKSEIKKHGKRLMEFDFASHPEVPQSPVKERIVICIMPENARDAVPDLEKYCSAAREELEKIGISEVRFVYEYGVYKKTEGDGNEKDGTGGAKSEAKGGGGDAANRRDDVGITGYAATGNGAALRIGSGGDTMKVCREKPHNRAA